MQTKQSMLNPMDTKEKTVVVETSYRNMGVAQEDSCSADSIVTRIGSDSRNSGTAYQWASGIQFICYLIKVIPGD